MVESGGRDRDSMADGDPGADEPWYVREGSPEAPWQDLFLGESPRTILYRLCDDDALRLWDLCQDRLSEVVVLVHVDRLASRAVARVAYGAAEGYDGKPPLLTWLRERIDQSITELLEEDVENEYQGTTLTGEERERYVAMIPRETGIAGNLARRACVHFNALPTALREPFFRTVFERWTIEEYAMKHDLSLDDVVHRIEETTRHLVHSVENGTDGKERPGP